MYENELIAIFEQLEAEGWRPMLCDAEILSYDRYVPCGDPTIVFEDTPDSFSFPNSNASSPLSTLSNPRLTVCNRISRRFLRSATP